MREIEAAELALEDLIRSLMHHRPERSPYPTVNLFGPPIFGPGAAAEYAEAERLLDMIGVEVNARVPLGAHAGDLDRLPRGWANVLLYREVGESATLYLQDEFGMPRVTTPMIGAAGTGAVLRSVGELCQLDPKSVQRAIWAELARTAKLPWYARLEPPETFQDRRVAIFGDFTYPLGLGYALAREVGLEISSSTPTLSQKGLSPKTILIRSHPVSRVPSPTLSSGHIWKRTWPTPSVYPSSLSALLSLTGPSSGDRSWATPGQAFLPTRSTASCER
jgi:light-independent protochlorophyllide reductase subunit B